MTERPAAAHGLQLHLAYDPRVNLALQQNAIPAVRRLRIEHQGEAALEDLTLAVWAEPELCPRWERRLARLDPGGSWDPGLPDLPLSAARLANLTEREAGLLRVEVRAASAPEPLLDEAHPLELLAYNEWGGVGSLPESLAAFVMPNHPAVASLLQAARGRLEGWTGSPAFDGYQSRDLNRARLQAAALYAAVADLDITYVGTPASFERAGQKVRTPDQVLDARMGNCLDLSALLAAALEQAGLHPLIVFVEGHAFPGVWLVERALPQPAEDDPLALRKRVEVGELALFDSSSAAARPRISFEEAEATAARHLADPARFLYAVDIQACRERRIRPLPLRLKEGAGYALVESAPGGGPGAAEAAGEAPPAPLAFPDRSRPAGGAALEGPARRVERWKGKLLDLSMRNRLLNYRGGSKSVPLLCPDLALLEDRLADGQPFLLLPRPDRRDPRDPELHRAQTGEDLERQLLLRALEGGRIHADLPPADLDRRLLTLSREARSSLEESGASTLFLALGLLEWFETPTSQEPRRAPLLLLPVELLRGAVTEGFRVRLADQEARLNVTLVEKLRRDFGLRIDGLAELPQDASGLDLPRILDTFRRAVLELPRWRVVEEAHLGQFAFMKFLMWLDLEARGAELLESPAVRHLLDPVASPLPPARFPDPAELDARPPAELFCPLDADSSQLQAVLAVEEGHSFVLQGPPGTGKSQTITNLIAHSLAQGKTVLFVSEKRAALEVVHRRLSGIGLAPFCLELHSNKARKVDVTRQLQEALTVSVAAHPADWEVKAARIEALRRELNGYVEAAHRPRPLGRSVFEVISALVGLKGAPRVDLDAEGVDREGFERLEGVVDRLAAAAAPIGAPPRHPWWGARWTGWSPMAQREVEASLEEVARAFERLQAAVVGAAATLGWPQEAWGADDLERMQALAAELLASPSPPLELLVRPRWGEARRRVEELLEHRARREQGWAALAPHYGEELLTLDLAALRAAFEACRQSHPLVAWFQLWGPRGRLSAAARSRRSVAEVADDLALALEVVAEDRWLEEAAGEGQALLGGRWRGAATDPAEVQELLEAAERLRRHLGWLEDRFPGGPGLAGRLDRPEAVAAGLAADAADRLDPSRAAGQALRALGEAWAGWRRELAPLSGRLAVDEERAWGPRGEPGLLERLGARLAGWRAGAGGLRDWSAWQEARGRAVEAGLGPLVEAFEAGRIPREQLAQAFTRSLLEDWLARTVSAEETLRTFRGLEHQGRIDRFRELDAESLRLMQRALAARLAARVPTAGLGGAVPGSELHLLQRELAKKRRHLPCRRLFEKLPNLLPRLKPCVLMSPLSVAQYLDPSLPPFDLVVFDEASQIPAWDAVGAIARGRQLVVVGDSRQLPPTRFFALGDDEDEPLEEGDVEEAESVLDECQASGLSSHPLRWHYRSRHEALITFSNHNYYESRLLTFPSAAARVEGLGVEWRPVPGVYDRGGSRTNRAEAEAVVAEVVAHLRDPARRARSLGVVTFNQTQQVLVEDLLEAARREAPELERWFSEAATEPVFVKNLENVQGDERDVILFSVTYAPDAAGRLPMNFGPLNREGGERRLNVAVTRARERVVVFSTLDPDQVDLARTAALGVRHLKEYLEYARRGPSALAAVTSASAEASAESPFEEEVGRELEARGWTIHRQVGCSGYRLDLAVVDPERPGVYLLGVECDGAAYHSSRSARDRDRLRQAVLEGLGWRMHRVWSSDWWHNPERELERLEEALRRARAEGPRLGWGSPPAAPGEPSAPEGLPPAPEAGPGPAPGGAPEPAPVGAPEPAPGGAPEPAPGGGPEAAPEAAPSEPGGRALPPGASWYEAPPAGGLLGQPEDIHDPRRTARVRAVLREVVAASAPLTLGEAARRVGARWGAARLTRRLEDRVRACAAGVARIEGDTLWALDQDPAGWRGYRLPPPSGEGRELDEVPLAELANAAEALLGQCGGLPLSELARALAQLFGARRVGSRRQARALEAIEALARQGRCRIEGEAVAPAP